MSSVVRRLATAWPTTVEPTESSCAAVRYLRDHGVAVPDAADIRAASYTAAVVVAVTATLLALVGQTTAGVVGILSGGCLAWAGPRAVRWPAAFARTRAVGSVASLVGLAATRLRLDPSPERAARFAARGTTGPLADALARTRRGSRASPDHALTTFAAAWSDWFPALERAAALLVAAADAPPDDRERLLTRAVETVGDELEARSAAFAADLRGPITGLYAFGVLLPLALVAALPAASVAGVPVTPTALAVVYDLCLPVAVVVAGARLALARPVAFPPPSVAGHPALPDWRRLWPAAGVAAAGCGWLATDRLVSSWAGPVAAVGFGLGGALLVAYQPAAAIRGRVRTLEQGLPDALALVGRRLADGQSVERAIETAGEAVPGPAGAAFATAARRQRTLGVGIERAFRGTHGPFVATPSRRAESVARLLAVAREEGRPAGRAVIREADRLRTVQTHERRARREIGRVTETLRHTAALFGPLVGGATVALSARLGGLPDSPGLGPPTLGPIVGCYVLWLAVTLPTLATAVERGLDRSLVGYRVGLATASGTASLLVGAAATGLVV